MWVIVLIVLMYMCEIYDSVNHARLRCNNSTPNYDLFIRNCVVSPACPHCNAPVEDVKHYFLHCPMYAAHRIALFTLLPTYCEINGCWLRTRKRLNIFCLDLRICNFSRMFVYLSKFSHLFLIHLVFLSLAW